MQNLIKAFNALLNEIYEYQNQFTTYWGAFIKNINNNKTNDFKK